MSNADYYDEVYEKMYDTNQIKMDYSNTELIESKEIINEATKEELYTDGTSFFKRILTIPDPNWEILLAIINVKKDNCSYTFKWHKPKEERNAKWISQKREIELAKGHMYKPVRDMKEISRILAQKHGIQLDPTSQR